VSQGDVKWKRWGSWKAHLYDGETSTCPHAGRNIRRGFVLASGGIPSTLVTLSGDAIGTHGVPYGPVCSTCLKTFYRTEGDAMR
jgi:hypothetical protein